MSALCQRRAGLSPPGDSFATRVSRSLSPRFLLSRSARSPNPSGQEKGITRTLLPNADVTLPFKADLTEPVTFAFEIEGFEGEVAWSQTIEPPKLRIDCCDISLLDEGKSRVEMRVSSEIAGQAGIEILDSKSEDGPPVFYGEFPLTLGTQAVPVVALLSEAALLIVKPPDGSLPIRVPVEANLAGIPWWMRRGATGLPIYAEAAALTMILLGVIQAFTGYRAFTGLFAVLLAPFLVDCRHTLPGADKARQWQEENAPLSISTGAPKLPVEAVSIPLIPVKKPPPPPRALRPDSSSQDVARAAGPRGDKQISVQDSASSTDVITRGDIAALHATVEEIRKKHSETKSLFDARLNEQADQVGTVAFLPGWEIPAVDILPREGSDEVSASRATADDKLLAAVNHWWDRAGRYDRQELSAYIQDVGLTAKFYRLDDAQGYKKGSDYRFTFSSSTGGEWVSYDEEPGSGELRILPTDPTKFKKFIHAMNVAELLFEGLTERSDEAKFKKAYRLCSLRETAVAGTYKIQARGLLLLEGDKKPANLPAPRLYESLKRRRPQQYRWSGKQISSVREVLEEDRKQIAEAFSSLASQTRDGFQQLLERLKHDISAVRDSQAVTPTRADSDVEELKRQLREVSALAGNLEKLKKQFRGELRATSLQLGEITSRLAEIETRPSGDGASSETSAGSKTLGREVQRLTARVLELERSGSAEKIDQMKQETAQNTLPGLKKEWVAMLEAGLGRVTARLSVLERSASRGQQPLTGHGAAATDWPTALKLASKSIFLDAHRSRRLVAAAEAICGCKDPAIQAELVHIERRDKQFQLAEVQYALEGDEVKLEKNGKALNSPFDRQVFLRLRGDADGNALILLPLGNFNWADYALVHSLLIRNCPKDPAILTEIQEPATLAVGEDGLFSPRTVMMAQFQLREANPSPEPTTDPAPPQSAEATVLARDAEKPLEPRPELAPPGGEQAASRDETTTASPEPAPDPAVARIETASEVGPSDQDTPDARPPGDWLEALQRAQATSGGASFTERLAAVIHAFKEQRDARVKADLVHVEKGDAENRFQLSPVSLKSTSEGVVIEMNGRHMAQPLDKQVFVRLRGENAAAWIVLPLGDCNNSSYFTVYSQLLEDCPKERVTIRSIRQPAVLVALKDDSYLLQREMKVEFASAAWR